MTIPEIRKDKSDNDFVLTVYFGGAGQVIKDQVGLGGFLLAHTVQTDNHQVLGFSGTFITHGILGLLFGIGLKSQVKQVKKRVLSLVAQGRKVVVNCYGHSRGAIAALLLAKELGSFDEQIVEINLALMDAVPGNFLVTSRIDFLNVTFTKQAMDLSKCHNLKRVLSLYTHLPSAGFAHSPLFSKYPKKAFVEEDVITEDHSHAQAQYLHEKTVYFFNRASLLTFVRIKNFLSQCGTAFQFLEEDFGYYYQLKDEKTAFAQLESADYLLARYQEEKQNLEPTHRKAHSYRWAQIETCLNRPYVNKHHRKLMQAQIKESAVEEKWPMLQIETGEHYALNIEPPLSPRLPRLERNYQAATMIELFRHFLIELLNSMSEQSRVGVKGKLIARLQAEAAQILHFQDQQSLKNAIRNVLALTMQRDRHSWSLFSTTRSGLAARTLLQQPQYQLLAELIQGAATHPVRYRDLRMFVLGENNQAYFNSKNCQHLYGILQQSSLCTDNFTVYRTSLTC